MSKWNNINDPFGIQRKLEEEAKKKQNSKKSENKTSSKNGGSGSSGKSNTADSKYNIWDSGNKNGAVTPLPSLTPTMEFIRNGGSVDKKPSVEDEKYLTSKGVDVDYVKKASESVSKQNPFLGQALGVENAVDTFSFEDTNKYYSDLSKNNYGLGNIDLDNRPKYREADGSFNTLGLIMVNDGKNEVLIPSITTDSKGLAVKLNAEEAVNRYLQTGEYFGKFNNARDAQNYAAALQAKQREKYPSAIWGGDSQIISGNEIPKQSLGNKLVTAGNVIKRDFNAKVNGKNFDPYVTPETAKRLALEAAERIESGKPEHGDGETLKSYAYTYKQYFPDDHNFNAIVDRAEMSVEASPVDAYFFNFGSGILKIASDFASFGNALGADKVPLLKDVTRELINLSDAGDYYASSYARTDYERSFNIVLRGMGNLTGEAALIWATAGASAASKGISLAKNPSAIVNGLKNMISNPAFWTSFTQTYGAIYQDNIDNNVNRDIASLKAAMTALPSAIIEIGGGIGNADEFAQSTFKTIYGEVIEEVSQGMVGNLVDKATTNPDMKWVGNENSVINPKQAAQEAWMTFISMGIVAPARKAIASRMYSGVFSSPGNTKEDSFVDFGKKVKDLNAEQVIIERAMNMPEKSRAYKLATELQQYASITEQELGELYVNLVYENPTAGLPLDEITADDVLRNTQIMNPELNIPREAAEILAKQHNLMRTRYINDNSADELIQKFNDLNMGFIVKRDDITNENGVEIKSGQGSIELDEETGLRVIKVSPTATAEGIAHKVITHELTHFLKQTGQFEDYRAAALDFMENNTDISIDERKDSIKNAYIDSLADARYEELKKFSPNANDDMMRNEARKQVSKEVASDEYIEEELIAKFTEEYVFAKREDVEKLVQTNPKLAQKVFDAISNFIKRLKNRFTGNYEIERKLYNARDIFARALNEQNVNSQNGLYKNGEKGYNGDVRYNIRRRQNKRVWLSDEAYAKLCADRANRQRGLNDDQLKWAYYAMSEGDLYLYKNYTVGQFEVFKKMKLNTDIDIQVAKEVIERLDNDAYGNTNDIIRSINSLRAKYRRQNSNIAGINKRGTPKSNDRVYSGQSGSGGENRNIGDTDEIGGNSSGRGLKNKKISLPENNRGILPPKKGETVTDSYYRSLVLKGDMETARAIVEDAAEKAGYTGEFETVVRDDNGDIIPPSKRFDSSKGNIRFDIPETKITKEDVETVREIGRKSINTFSSYDVKKSESWARKFYSELGTKSPYFRAWFGDWRANHNFDSEDSSKVKVIKASKTEGKNPRGVFVNTDTGWSINSSSVGYDETKSHSGKDEISLIAMRSVDEIIQNSILLDSEVSEYGRGKKSIYTAFMHKFYSPMVINGKEYIAKMSVDESYNPGQNDTIKKFYHIRAIEVEPISSVGIGFNHTPIIDKIGSDISISDLFALVKQNDKNFSPKPSSVVVNKDGTPKVVYHGTTEDFTEFDITKSRSWEGTPDYDLPGFYFSESIDESAGYGNAKPYYICITKPYEGDIYSLAKEKGSYRNAYEYLINEGYDGVIVDDMGEGFTEYIVLKPENIKSATDNIGTFDKGNKDVRYSIPEETQKVEASKVERRTYNELVKFFGLKNNNQNRSEVLPLLSVAFDEFTRKGHITESTKRSIFTNMLNRGVVADVFTDENDEFIWHDFLSNKHSYKMPDNMKGDFGNKKEYQAFARAAGRFKLSDKGMPIDIAYQAMNERFPDAFPDDIITPSDQAYHMAELAERIKPKEVPVLEQLEKYYDEEQMKAFKDYKYSEFEKVLNKFLNSKRDEKTFQTLHPDEVFDMELPFEPIDYETDLKTTAELKEEALKAFGAVKKGEVPENDIDVAKAVGDGTRKTRLHTRTILEGGLTSPEVSAAIEEGLYKGSEAFTYLPLKNVEQAGKARADIVKDGFEDSFNEITKIVKSPGQILDTYNYAKAVQLYNLAVQNKDYSRAVTIAGYLASDSTDAARALQARRIFKMTTPEGKLISLKRTVDRENANKKEGSPDIVIDEQLAENLLKAKGEKEIKKAVEAIQEDIVNQMDVDVWTKVNTWRYMAMLTNPVTHVRNVLGNVAMGLQSEMAAGIEMLAQSGMKSENKTLAFANKEDISYANEVFNEFMDVITGESKYSDYSKLKQKQKAFKTEILNKVADFNTNAMEAEDRVFLRRHFRAYFARYMSAKGYTQEFLKSGSQEAQEAFSECLEFAMNRAKENTFRADSKTAKRLQDWQDSSVWARVLLEGNVPFKRTPINIAKQGVKYSPLGFIDTAYKLYKVRTGDATAADVISSFSKASTGSIIFAAGMIGRAMGFLRGTEDDKEKDKIEKMMGHQDYSLVIGDKSYTLDWLSPTAIPLFMGVKLVDALQNEGLTPEEIIDSLFSVGEPMLSMSVLSSLENNIGSFAKSDSRIYDFVANSVSSYISSFVPQLLNKTARIVDGTQRLTAKDETNGLPGQQFVNSMINKIPGASKALEPRLDIFGREQKTGNFGERLLQNLLSPGYGKKIDKDNPVYNELLSLYEETGDTSIIPELPRNGFKVDGKEVVLTPKELTEYRTNTGKARYNIVSEMINDKNYKELTTEEKKTAYSLLWSFGEANTKAKISDYKLEGDDMKISCVLQNGVHPADYVLYKAKLKNFENDKGVSTQAQAISTAREMGYDDRTTLFLTYCGYLGADKAVNIMKAPSGYDLYNQDIYYKMFKKYGAEENITNCSAINEYDTFRLTNGKSGKGSVTYLDDTPLTDEQSMDLQGYITQYFDHYLELYNPYGYNSLEDQYNGVQKARKAAIQAAKEYFYNENKTDLEKQRKQYAETITGNIGKLK